MRSPPFVTTLTTATLAGLLAACNKPTSPPVTDLPGNPPRPTGVEEPGQDDAPPAPAPDELPPGNPPAPALPAWDDVGSGHPEGATNPPMPVLAVDAAGRCFKEWWDPRRVPTDAREGGRRVLAEGEASTGVEVQCPATEGATPKAP